MDKKYKICSYIYLKKKNILKANYYKTNGWKTAILFYSFSLTVFWTLLSWYAITPLHQHFFRLTLYLCCLAVLRVDNFLLFLIIWFMPATSTVSYFDLRVTDWQLWLLKVTVNG